MGWTQTWLYWFLKHKQRKRHIRESAQSQYGQDQVVYELLGKPGHGVYVDIGANDGVTLSNTLLFEQMGWEGVCIEPHPKVFELLQDNRRCPLINACILDQNGVVDFVEVDGYANMLSGIKQFFSASHQERIDREIQRHGGAQRTIPIQAITFQSIQDLLDLKPIDYLSIDTEGCELAILKSIDLKKTLIRSIGVENGSGSPALFRYLTRNGYDLATCVGCDEIYLRIH
ncbi:MAG: FkbM family methyltransferase [Planctomycetota bacterium]